MPVYIPENYKSKLDVRETQKAIEFIKDYFRRKLASALNLTRVSSPLFVENGSGLNDTLDGTERPVVFDAPAVNKNVEIVQSLAKWKRYALARYGFPVNRGLYTDMNAIRRDDVSDNIHSIYVDQWDWEKVITKNLRNETYLKETVKKIVDCIRDTADAIKANFGVDARISGDVTFVSAQNLEDMYPELTPAERESRFVAERGTAFVMGIGGKLRSGRRHGGRAPDYDDWNLNGDIIFYNRVLKRAFEISSMGIRVDEKTLVKQLAEAGCLDRLDLPFHKALVSGELPLTIGGGIGQSRLCMLLLDKAHIGEVQCSVWDSETAEVSENAGVTLL